jgi:hybrid cluster-associated redox disulfide protein
LQFDLRKEKEVTITKNLPIGKVVQEHPETIPVFMQHGLMCFGCAAARFEDIEQGAMAHGIDVEALVKDLNTAVAAEAGTAKAAPKAA